MEEIDLAKNLTSLLILLSQVQSGLNINNPFSVQNSTEKFTTLLPMPSGQTKKNQKYKSRHLSRYMLFKICCFHQHRGIAMNAKICGVEGYVLCASCYQGGRSRCCLNDSNSLSEFIANQRGTIWEYFHVLACWCVHMFTVNSTNNCKNMETPPDFLTSTVVQMHSITKNLLLTLGKMQIITWERLGTWLRRLSIFKTNVSEENIFNCSPRHVF